MALFVLLWYEYIVLCLLLAIHAKIARSLCKVLHFLVVPIVCHLLL